MCRSSALCVDNTHDRRSICAIQRMYKYELGTGKIYRVETMAGFARAWSPGDESDVGRVILGPTQ